MCGWLANDTDCNKINCWIFFLNRIREQAKTMDRLVAEVGMLTNSMQQLDAQNTCLRDEHTALQLTSNTLEEKLRKLQVSVSVSYNPDPDDDWC